MCQSKKAIVKFSIKKNNRTRVLNFLSSLIAPAIGQALFEFSSEPCLKFLKLKMKLELKSHLDYDFWIEKMQKNVKNHQNFSLTNKKLFSNFDSKYIVFISQIFFPIRSYTSSRDLRIRWGVKAADVGWSEVRTIEAQSGISQESIAAPAAVSPHCVTKFRKKSVTWHTSSTKHL